MTGHTPTPWQTTDKFGPCNISAGHGRSICSTGGYSSSGPNAENVHLENEANAARIIACVNACEGLSIEALESGVVGQAADTITELCEALRAVGVEADGMAMTMRRRKVFDAAAATLAKTEAVS
jgi:hypothetical protein